MADDDEQPQGIKVYSLPHRDTFPLFLLCKPDETPDPFTFELLQACQDGNLPRVKQLLQTQHQHQDTDEDDQYIEDYGFFALLSVCRFGHLEIVKFLLDPGLFPGGNDHPVHVDRTNQITGCTPLMFACFYGHLPIVKYLIEQHKADLDIKSCLGNTPLIYASMEGHLDVVKYLLEQHHVNPHLTDNHGYTALRHALLGRHFRIVLFLIIHIHLNLYHEESILVIPRLVTVLFLFFYFLTSFLFPK